MADIDSFVTELQQHLDHKTHETYGKETFDRWDNPPNMGEPPLTNCKSAVTGQCGDTMRIFLHIENDEISAAGFYTTGCGPSKICGSLAAELALHTKCDNVTAITGEVILGHLEYLPEDHHHCAWLAANALHEAVGDYYRQYHSHTE